MLVNKYVCVYNAVKEKKKNALCFNHFSRCPEITQEKCSLPHTTAAAQVVNNIIVKFVKKNNLKGVPISTQYSNFKW